MINFIFEEINFEFEIAILHTMVSPKISLLVIIISFCALNPSFGNKTNIDSLFNQIKKDKILLATNSDNNTNSQIETLKNIGANYQRLNEFDSAIVFYNNGAKLAEEAKNEKMYSSISYNLSLIYLHKGMYNKALEKALVALTIDRKDKNPKNIASSLNSVALIYQEWGMYDKSLEYRLESIKVSSESNNQIEIANGNYNLGSLYQKIDKPKQAEEYYLLAKTQFEELLEEKPNDPNYMQGLSECIYSLGALQLYNRKYDKAIIQFNNAIQIKQLLSDKIGLGNCYYQVGLAAFLQENYEMARQNLFMSLQYKNMVEDKKGIALAYFRLGDINFRQSNYSDAKNFINKSISIADEFGGKEILSENYKLLYQIAARSMQYKEALSFHKKFKAYADSVQDENTRKIVEELSIRFETDKKEKENLLLQRENEISTLTIQKQKSIGRYLIGLIALIIAIVIILYTLYRSKKKTNTIISHKNNLLGQQNTQIASQKKLIEEKNLNLTDSIQYAKRIQESMLSDISYLNELLDDAFILFKPKDIVSGDFFWFAKMDNKFIISAIDCTGHGVPGAFMSMLGNSILNQIVLNEGITSPDKILEKLSAEIQLALKQKETANRDGMDMALCTIDLTTKNVEFAGAKNPLVYIKNGEAVRLKGDKLPIGYSHYEDSKFNKHEIENDQPTTFYMFSDGYADQFGGDEGRKFMIKRLQNLLVEIHDKPMETQKNILNDTIEAWKKNEDQIDDILIVGFKID